MVGRCRRHRRHRRRRRRLESEKIEPHTDTRSRNNKERVHIYSTIPFHCRNHLDDGMEGIVIRWVLYAGPIIFPVFLPRPLIVP